jgi:hypothetical protein
VIKRFLLFFLLLFLVGCNSKKDPDTKSQSALPDTTQKTGPFIPPPDSSITVKQMKNWLSCNHRLDSLAYLYSDSFKTEDIQLRLKYQKNFNKSQDNVCISEGLTGGYKEYRWIMENIGNPKNKSILDSLKDGAR